MNRGESMKLYKKIIFILFLTICLASCSESYEFIKKDWYSIKYDTTIPLIKESKSRIAEKYDKLYFYNHNDRDMNYKLTLNPAYEKEIVFSDTSLYCGEEFLEDSIVIYQDKYFPHFKREDGYKVIISNFMKSKIMIYIDKINEDYCFRFAHSTDDHITCDGQYGPYPFNVNVISYNGIYAYNLENYRNDNSSAYEIIYLLANTVDLEYDIYCFDNIKSVYSEIYLIPKDDRFSKKFIKYFNEEINMHLLNIESIREQI